MSQADVEIVMGFFDAYNTGDADAFMSFFATSVEAFPDASVFPESGPRHGHDDLKRFFEEAGSAWVNPRAVVKEVLVLQDGRVLVRFDWGGEGASSGMEIASSLTGIHTMRDGLISHVEWFFDHDQALKAVGLKA